NISTALGVAYAYKATTAVLGDLSFLHDLTGLIQSESINCRFIVINNDGGGIFSTLPQRGVNGFETVFGTPHGLNPAAIAQAMGITAKQVSSLKELEALGVDQFSIYLQHDGKEQTLEAYGERVMPAIAELARAKQ
ncbi:MAG: hypothetical protein EBZ46_04455, partial [Actinobacteria bacterium]|nr:hypothetical protein [Actinomycetota bacterium]